MQRKSYGSWQPTVFPVVSNCERSWVVVCQRILHSKWAIFPAARNSSVFCPLSTAHSTAMSSSKMHWIGWSAKKFNATVANDIWPEVTFFTLIATMVTLVSELTPHSLAISNQLLTVLGLVLGLVVSFRTSSAYERYQEGRKLWTNIQLASRNMAHMIWNHIPVDRSDKKTKKDADISDFREVPATDSVLAAVIEKRTVINLVQAFAVSVKHMLRGEPGIYYEDLYPLVSFLPRYVNQPPHLRPDEDVLPMWRSSNTDAPSRPDPEKVKSGSSITMIQTHSDPGVDTLHHERHPDRSNSYPMDTLEIRSYRERKRKSFDPEQALPNVPSDRPLLPARNPPKATMYDYVPPLRLIKPILKLFHSKHSEEQGRSVTGKKQLPDYVESNIPLEISLFLSSYLAWLLKKGYLQPPIAAAITTNLASLQENAVNLERIRNTPLPFAYQAHLRMSMWLYLIFLPFEMESSFGYLTIPATAFSAFLLLGFLEIGHEIENPFNYDLNDLDLDGFCLGIQRELAEITVHTSPDPETYIFSMWNQPFAPADRRTAQQMIHDVNHEYHHGPEAGMASMRRTLLRSWRDVDMMTRKHRSDVVAGSV